MTDVTIPRELGEDLVSLVDNLLDHEAEFRGGTIRRIADHVRPQLHPHREPRVGDVKVAETGYHFVRMFKPLGPAQKPWQPLDVVPWSPYTDAEMAEYPTLLNIYDELKAREAGPVVHLDERTWGTVLVILGRASRIWPEDTQPAMDRLTAIAHIDAALADYRQRKEREE